MNDLTLIDDLTMHALITRGERGLAVKEVCKSLKTIGELSIELVTAALGRLCERGFVEEAARAPRQRSVRFRLLAAGRECLLSHLPETLMTGRARRKAARILAIQRTFGIEPKLAIIAMQKKDGLATYLLAKRLGFEFRASTTAADLARLAAAAELGVNDNTPETLWMTLIARCVTPHTAETSAEPASAASRDRFAEEVRHAAPRAMNGWLGPRKLFIHRAWEAWRQEVADPLDLPEFKSNLVQASRAGALSLARADFTIGLDPEDLASSETRDGSEVFHFLSIAQEVRQ